MKKCVIFDLDGTLSDGRHRLHLLPDIGDAHLDTAWSTFSLAADGDAPFLDNIAIMNVLKETYYTIILTGRGAISLEVTVDWLADNYCHYDELIMRPIGCCQLDTIYKRDAVKEIQAEYDIVCAWDDKDSVCEMFRDMGITAHQVTEYDGKLRKGGHDV
jgi:hypothetical protein